MPTEHVTIGHAETHEPRHISISSGVDAGKVITPSDSVAGTSVLRFLEGDEIASSNGPQGYTLISNGDGTTSWVQSSAIYGYSNDFSGVGAAIDPVEPIPVNITHRSSNNQAGGNWVNGTNFLTIPQSGVYKVYFSVSLETDSSNGATLYALASDALPASTDMFTTECSNASERVSISGVTVSNYNSGDQVRLYIYFTPNSAPGGPESLNAYARSMYIEKIA